MLNRLQPVQKREAGVTANVLLSLIDRMKKEVSQLPIRYSQFEAYTYGVRGNIALDGGTKEDARRAVAHFENQLEVNEAIGSDEGIFNAKSNIAIAKSKNEGGSNEGVMKANKEFYEMCVAEYGEEHEYTILTGKNYAVDLQNANNGEEAGELLIKLLATSKLVLGSHHNTTKDIESVLQWIEARQCVTNPLYKSTFFVSLLIGVLAMLYQLTKS
jgi:hypothetical protein